MLVPQLKCFTLQSLRATGKQNRGITLLPSREEWNWLLSVLAENIQALCRTDGKEPAEPFGHFLIIHDFILPLWLPILYKSSVN